MGILSKLYYLISLTLFLLGFYTLLTNTNLIKKMIGLNIMDSSIFLFLVSIGYIKEGSAPIIKKGLSNIIYVNPMTHALVLIGIVVTFSISVFAFALIIKLHFYYDSIDTDEIMRTRGN